MHIFLNVLYFFSLATGIAHFMHTHYSPVFITWFLLNVLLLNVCNFFLCMLTHLCTALYFVCKAKQKFFSTFTHKPACLHPLSHMYQNIMPLESFSHDCPLSSFFQLCIHWMSAHAICVPVRHNLPLFDPRLVMKLIDNCLSYTMYQHATFWLILANAYDDSTFHFCNHSRHFHTKCNPTRKLLLHHGCTHSLTSTYSTAAGLSLILMYTPLHAHSLPQSCTNCHILHFVH
ncbi:Hypothetical predicted protein [Octopus vulgaris]|uniref:Uncharacterized protein n=1 Tax=Octopus vulgaris TaxID=6645 RepID=A0AA36BA75_OCTVU|nr:Hypothetical predicted protein [Octopus vulgaris]